MAKPNYGYEKRQRDLAKKQKKEEKRLKKAAAKAEQTEGQPPAENAGQESPDPAPADDSAGRP